MKAIVGHSLATLESYGIADIDRPALTAGQALVRVAACGVGYVDSLVALGRYQVKPPTPHVPGQEIAGVVVEVADDVSHIRVGDRVLGMAQRGFAQYALASAVRLHPMPAHMSFEQGAAFPLNYLTAFHGLADRAALAAGETVLIFGAAGGVGSAAVQLGKAMGARVIAAASTAEKRQFAQHMGADAVIDLAPEGWRDRLKPLGSAPDIVFDPVCGPLFEPAFRSIAWRGRYMVVGFVGGPIPALPANLTLLKGAALMGVDVRQFQLFEPAKARAAMATLLDWVEEGRITPRVGQSFAFADFDEAMSAALSGKAQGKIVLRID